MSASGQKRACAVTWTAAYAHILEEFTLGSSDRLVAPERVALALEPEPCLESRPTEVVAQHAEAVPRDVAGIVRQRRRQMAQLHPPLRLPPHELDVVC